MDKINFQKTFVYKNSALPPWDAIKEICDFGELFLMTVSDGFKTWYIVQSPFGAHELIEVIIKIISKFPFKEYPFEEDISDFEAEYGVPVEGPEDLN